MILGYLKMNLTKVRDERFANGGCATVVPGFRCGPQVADLITPSELASKLESIEDVPSLDEICFRMIKRQHRNWNGEAKRDVRMLEQLNLFISCGGIGAIERSGRMPQHERSE
jgi:hypothetical protein